MAVFFPIRLKLLLLLAPHEIILTSSFFHDNGNKYSFSVIPICVPINVCKCALFRSKLKFLPKNRIFFDFTMKMAAFGGKLAASVYNQKKRNFIFVSTKKTASKNIHFWLFSNFRIEPV